LGSDSLWLESAGALSAFIAELPSSRRVGGQISQRGARYLNVFDRKQDPRLVVTEKLP
jgi:hypothetical protein